MPLGSSNAPAVAEVCDKMAYETWVPEHGPVGFTLTPGMLLVLAISAGAAVAVYYFRLGRIAIIFGGVVVGLGALVANVHFSESAVLGAIEEGCFSLRNEILLALILPFSGLMILSLGFWIERSRRRNAV